MLVITRQASDRFPGKPCRLKVYHQKVYLEQYDNIFICDKPTLFLPTGRNLFKVFTNRADNCTNVLIPNTEQTGIETKEKSIALKQRIQEQRSHRN